MNPTAKRVLIVDDTAIVRDPIAMCLQAAGFDTAVASNGEEALASMAECPPDLVLLDIAMPVLDGLSCLTAMRAEARFDSIPVILLTARTEKQYVVHAAQLGVTDYLLKSRFSLSELV